MDWRPGERNRKNLGGTIRTLDGVKGPVDLGEGVLSRDGWYLLDDSQTPLLTSDWVRERPGNGNTDWYFSATGPITRRRLKALTRIGGAVPLPRKYVLGAWYSRYWPYTSQDYREIVEGVRQHDFPLDVIVMDMDWQSRACPARTVRARFGQATRGTGDSFPIRRSCCNGSISKGCTLR